MFDGKMEMWTRLAEIPNVWGVDPVETGCGHVRAGVLCGPASRVELSLEGG